jgi:YVTN family beta-propeller protein
MPIARHLVPLVLLAGACARSSTPTPDAAPARSGTVVVSNMGENSATLVDAATGRGRATLPTGEGPHEVAVSHDGRWAVVSNYGVQRAAGHTLTLIDVAAATLAGTIDLGDHRRPHGMAFLPGDSVLAVTSEASRAVLLVHMGRGAVLGTIPTNAPASHMLALTADGSRLYTSNVAAGSVTEQDVPGRAALRAIAVAPAVEGIAVTPSGDEVWVGSNQRRTVSIVRAGAVVDTLAGFGMPYRLAITRDGRTAVITDPPKSQVVIVDVATHRPRATVEIPADGVTATAEFKGSASPEGVTLSPDGRTAYVALQGANRVAVIDIASARLVGTLPAGAGPDGIGMSVVAGR